jgi:O-antigen/teichoic acid export membrane protein
MTMTHDQPVPTAGPASQRPLHDERLSPGSRIVRNALALSFARPLTWASSIGLTILLPRYLGDVNLGKINFAFAFADWAGLLASLGISTYLTKEVARRSAGAGSLILNALLVRLALALGIGSLAALLATVMGYDDLTRQLVYLLCTHMLLTVIAGVLTGALQGVQQLRAVAAIDAGSKLVLLGVVAVVCFQGHGPIGVAVAYIASDVVAIVCLLYAVQRHVGLGGPIDPRTWRSLILGGMPFLVWETALLTYARVDVVLLSMFTHDAVLGWYHAAYRLISIPLFAPVVLMTVLFPALSAASRDPAQFNALARRGVHTAVLMAVPMAIGLMILADKLIQFLGYPESFANSVVPIIILAVSLPVVAINMIVGSALNALDRQRQWALAGVGAAVLNPALNLLAIPYTQAAFGNGGIGAAAVTSLTELFLLALGQYLLPRGVLNAATLIGVLKCLSVGLTMAAGVWFARELPILVTIPLGALIYGVGSLAVGTISLGDLRHVRGFLTERRAARAAAEGAA